MSLPTDLLPYGEQFAELGLVVRQLDDGSLTVASDDSLVDEDRVRVLATPSGLSARLRLFPIASPNDLLFDALEQLNSTSNRLRYSWVDGGIYCESALPWTQDQSYPLESLRSLYEGVDQSLHQRANLQKLAGVEVSPPPPLAAAAPVAPPPPPPLPTPPSAIGAPAREPGPSPQDGPVLPPSYLPGSGQRSPDDGLTRRYGGVNANPGRADAPTSGAAAGARPAHFVRPKPSGGGSSGAGVAVVVALLLLGGAGIAAFLFRDKLHGSGPSPASSPAVASKTSKKTSGESTTRKTGEDDPDSGGSDPVRPRPSPRNSPRPQPSEAPKSSDVYELAASKNPNDRFRAVRRWQTSGKFKLEGARLKMLRALASGPVEREVGQMITKTVRDRPPSTFEALDCLELANPALKRLLLEQLGQAKLTEDERIVTAEVLGELEDTRDCLVEEILIRQGKPRKGGFDKLLAARGADWLKLGGGRKLLATLPSDELTNLITHPEREVRVLAIDLLADRRDDPEAALSALNKALSDKDAVVRQRAVESMGGMGSGRAAWYLGLAIARETDARTQELIRTALRKLPLKSAVNYLDKLVKSKSAKQRLAGVMALRSIPAPAAVTVMVRAVKDEDRLVRVEALGGLLACAKSGDLRPAVGLGVLSYRRLAKDRSDPEARRLARQLCLKIDGKLPR